MLLLFVFNPVESEYLISNEFFPSMLVILMTSLLEEQLKAVTVVLSVKQVEKAVGDRCETMFDNIY